MKSKNLKILNKKEIKQLLKNIEEQFGCQDLVKKLDYVYLLNSKNKLYILNKDYARIDDSKLRIDSVGLYLGEVKDKHIRLSIEGAQIISKYATKNIVELSDDKVRTFVKGEDINLECVEHKNEEGFVLVKNKNNIYGCGSIKEGKLLNYIPKVRRIVCND